MAAEAITAFERSDWVRAARLLREAIVHQAANLTLHYYLAIAATHLQLRDEAVREFQWVLLNAPPGSAEAVAAKEWLTAAGVLGAVPTAAAAPERPADTTGAGGALRGQVVWNVAEDPVSVSRLQLFLKGLPDTPTRDQYYVLRTENDGQFHFRKVMPGPYKLTNRIAGKPHWRLRVTVPEGEPMTIDLDPQNSTRTRDDFPQDDQ